MSGPASANSRVPWPRTTGTMSRIDLVDEVVLEQPSDQGAAAVHLQLTPRLAFSSPMAAARSPERTVVFAQPGSVTVVDARYLGFVFRAAAIGWLPGSSAAARARSSAPQKLAKSS